MKLELEILIAQLVCLVNIKPDLECLQSPTVASVPLESFKQGEDKHLIYSALNAAQANIKPDWAWKTLRAAMGVPKELIKLVVE